jgi:hypothetical protein
MLASLPFLLLIAQGGAVVSNAGAVRTGAR